jgi:sulfur carrier protein ThiS
VALVTLHGTLKKMAGDHPRHPVDGGTVAEVLRALERAQPPVAGWILDERGLIRRHIKVFVDGEEGHEDTPVGEGGRVDVLPAISGG